MTNNEYTDKKKRNRTVSPKKRKANIAFRANISNKPTPTMSKHKCPDEPPAHKEENSFKWLGIVWGVQDFIQIILAILTFLTLIAFIVYSSLQYSQTRKAINLSDTANFYTKLSIEMAKYDSRISDTLNRKAIEIADSSMKVSSKIAETQEDFTKKELRAYIEVTSIDAMLVPDEVFRYTLVYNNTGKTPAHKISCNFTCKIGGSGVFDSDIEKINNELNINTVTETRGAGRTAHYEYQTGNIVTKSTYNRIVIGNMNLFVYGIISYEDIFGETHKTSICLQYFPQKTLVFTNVFYTYERYNYSD